jgi:hypothetical protein
MPDDGKRSWVRPRFTLGALLLVITFCGIFFAYIASVRRWNEHRKKAFEALLSQDVDFLDRGFRTPIRRPERTALERLWASTTGDPSLPKFATVILREAPTGAINDDDLKSLEYFPEIEEVHCIGSAAVTEEGLRVFSKLPKLKMIAVQNIPHATGEFLNGVRDSSLEGIRISQPSSAFVTGNLKALIRFKNLRSLAINDALLWTDDSLRDVDLPPSVTDLELTRVGLGDETLTRWLSQRYLRILSVQAPITRAIAPALIKQKNLEILIIKNATLIDEDFAFLKGCPKLQRLILTAMPVRGELLAFLPHPEKFHHLNFSNTLFSDEQLSQLSKFPNLSALDLAWTPLTGESFKADMGLPRPGMFFLTGTRFSDQGKEAFSKFKGLRTVQLPSKWSPADYERFTDSDKPVNPQFNSYFFGAPGGQTYGPPTLRQEPMDNCPSDLMKPVADLHALGRAEEQEIQRRQGRSP